MKEIRVTKFQALDGKLFDNQVDCIAYEREVLENRHRLDEISEVLTDMFNVEASYNIELKVEARIGESRIHVKRDDMFIELNENLDGFMSGVKFDRIQQSIYRLYNFRLDVPYWYWSK